MTKLISAVVTQLPVFSTTFRLTFKNAHTWLPYLRTLIWLCAQLQVHDWSNSFNLMIDMSIVSDRRRCDLKLGKTASHRCRSTHTTWLLRCDKEDAFGCIMQSHKWLALITNEKTNVLERVQPGLRALARDTSLISCNIFQMQLIDVVEQPPANIRVVSLKTVLVCG